MLLSACLIVKDEALTIKQCIESLLPIADEIIVVDTGSTDETLAIIKVYDKVTVYTFPWDGDFSHARNASLSYAQGQYVLVIDADEFLEKNDHHKLLDLLSTTTTHGFFVNVINYTGSIHKFKEARPASLLRLFRRGYTFEGKVHEQVWPNIERAGGNVENTDIRLHHMGYLDEIIAAHNKIERNEKLIAEELKKDPESLFHRTNMIAELSRKGDFKASLVLVEETLKWVEEHPDKRIDHIYLRVRQFHSIALWELGRQDEAIRSMKETIQLVPTMTDAWFRLGHMFILQNKAYEALEPLQKCVQLGEQRGTLIDVIAGSGSYFAFSDLAVAWRHLGDEQVASQYNFQSFLLKPDNVMAPFELIYDLHTEPTVLETMILPKLENYPESLCNYIEQAVNWQIPSAQYLLEQTKKRFGFAPAFYRPAFQLALLDSDDMAKRLTEEVNDPDMHILYGIHRLEQGDRQEGQKYLHQAGERGRFVLALLESEQYGKKWNGDLNFLLRDFIAAKAYNLLIKWLPFANDRLASINFLRFTPFRAYLEKVAWPGENEIECDYRALHEFHERNFEQAQKWLMKSMQYSPTITKFLLAADLALVHQDVDTAQKQVYFAKILFPESKLLDQVERQIGAFVPKLLRLEELLMNPAEIYRQRTVQSMPLHIQLAQLHTRGATLTKQVKEDYSQDRLQEGRANIEEIQNIITFLRSSLDPKLEVSTITDQTYAFFYKVTVQWFIQPNSIDEDYEAMLNFWESWADTWMKVKPSTTP
nr:glycosyltransferase family 2 protein [Bacilli bacterium]